MSRSSEARLRVTQVRSGIGAKPKARARASMASVAWTLE